MPQSLQNAVYFILMPFVMCLMIQTSHAEEPTWSNYFGSLAKSYRLKVTNGTESRNLDLVPTPLAKWSHPVRGGDDGAIFLWLDQGRPAAAAAFFVWPNGDKLAVSHERVSLSDSPLTAALNDIRWNSPAKGIQWSKVDTQTQAANVGLQARSIARRFQATSRSTDGVLQPLRLIERPLYEYRFDQDEIFGSLMRFVEGTDTEIFMLLEYRQPESAWYYALARLSDLELHVTLDDKQVWHMPRAEYNQANSHYYCESHASFAAPPEISK